MARLRYLVTLAQLPDEASWCSCETLEELRSKLRELWLLEDPVCKFYLGSGSTSSIVTANMVTEDEFKMWLRKDDDGVARPMSSRLLAYDRVNEVAVHHSSDGDVMPRRSLIDWEALRTMKGSYTLRHSALNELIVVPEAVSNAMCWGIAVKRVQEAWGVVRPVFRYVDENKGDRVNVTILNADDFSQWVLHGHPISAELVVYEHAAPTVLAEVRRAKAEAAAARATQFIRAQHTADAEAAKKIQNAEQQRMTTRSDLPHLRNKFSANLLEELSSKDQNVQVKTPAERHAEKLASVQL